MAQKRGGSFNLISFGVSSSSYFFFSFLRKTSQMINMTMRTPRDIPTAAPANLATSLTSVDGKKQVMSDGEAVTVTYYTYTMTLVPPETPQHFLHLFTAHKSIELFLLSYPMCRFLHT